ncbi:MAG: peptidoglycan DD-metalloendopeptidase family protein [Anaerolineaceae bacterium]|nr:peptidoglycan DD-metalloendopeptidase family protein [Anaerolineaceae bacterium]MBN2678507.1 peptidoglycan DD-metalloendopeptidase family protein [Anaerolineaceae bacterium]
MRVPQPNKKEQVDPSVETRTNSAAKQRWVTQLSWLLTAIVIIGLASIALWMPEQVGAISAPAGDEMQGNNGGALGGLPVYEPQVTAEAIFRNTDNHTDISAEYRTDVIEYVVDSGDSIFRIAKQFNLKPESVLWANEDSLFMGVDYLSVGMNLKIPPTDGIYYEWKENDQLDAVAGKYNVTPDDILLWVGNDVDLTNPGFSAGDYIMIPGGVGEYKQWVVPVIPTGKNGAVATLSGPGACSVMGYVLIGTNTFIWPAGNRSISGNDYWEGHQGIDISAGLGAPIYAADNGTVVYAGWNPNGYGNTVMIDHGTGYSTLYAHLSAVNVACAVGVAQGQVIGYGGSTGNSTGPHLHFEIRYQGGTINPWTLLE